MDLTKADVLIVLDDHQQDAIADVYDWYPPGTDRPPGAPEQWTATVDLGYPAPDVMPVGARGELHLYATGAHSAFTVTDHYADTVVQVLGRGAVTP